MALPNGYAFWPECPVKLIKSPWWQYLVELFNARNVSPLGSWPQGFAAWVVDGMAALNEAMEAYLEEKRKKATGNQSPG